MSLDFNHPVRYLAGQDDWAFHVRGIAPKEFPNEFPVYIEVRSQRDGSEKWAVVNGGGSVLHKEHLFFVYEPMSSLRDEEFLRTTRFNTKEDALKVFKDYLSQPNNPYTKYLE